MSTHRPELHIAKRTATASIRAYKLSPLLKRLRPELASRLVKATVIPIMTFGLEVHTMAHVNEEELAPVNICLRRAARIIAGGLKKAEIRDHCTEAGLPTPHKLVKRTAIQAGARLISLREEHPLVGTLP